MILSISWYFVLDPSVSEMEKKSTQLEKVDGSEAKGHRKGMLTAIDGGFRRTITYWTTH